MEKQRVLITGASGFVGRHVVARLLKLGFLVRIVVRSDTQFAQLGEDKLERVICADLTVENDLDGLFNDVDVVVHLAGKAHAPADSQNDAAYQRINVGLTQRLLDSAITARVTRFIFMSTAKVHGDVLDPQTAPNGFTENTPYAPRDAYARSKVDAEQIILAAQRRGDIQTTILRPPMVYGPDPKANLKSLMQVIESGWPLPLGSVKNRRSFIGVDNLSDIVCRCVTDDRADGQIFLVSDDADMATSDLIRLLGRALQKPARVIPFPKQLLVTCLSLLGRSAWVDRLVGDLYLNIDHVKTRLGWHPVCAPVVGIQRILSHRPIGI